jgi:hypothetical protein
LKDLSGFSFLCTQIEPPLIGLALNIAAPPMVSDLRIVGDLIEGNKVAVTSTFSGGAEGPSRVQWFKTNTPHDLSDESTLEAISNSKVAKVMLLH